MSRHFLNLPALHTRAEVESELARRQATRAAGFMCIDGLRMMAEIPEHVALGMIANNPWAPLVEMWALGAAPVGIVDGEFVVYVPAKESP